MRTQSDECIFPPRAYSGPQLLAAFRVADAIGRGKFVLTELPALCPVCLGKPVTFCIACGRS